MLRNVSLIKRCMLVSLEMDADFRGGVHAQQCSRPIPRPTPTVFKAEARPPLLDVIRAGIRAQHHHRRHRGIACSFGLASAPSVLLHGSRSLRSPGCYLPHSQDWTLQLRQVLHCDPRLLSVGGGGGFLRWCMANPALGAIPLGSHSAAREGFRRAASNPA